MQLGSHEVPVLDQVALIDPSVFLVFAQSPRVTASGVCHDYAGPSIDECPGKGAADDPRAGNEHVAVFRFVGCGCPQILDPQITCAPGMSTYIDVYVKWADSEGAGWGK